MNRTYLALGFAAALWGVVFALTPVNFWVVMAGAALLVAAYALYFGREELKGLFAYKTGTIMAGLAGAVFLYAIFVIGSWTSRELLPFAHDEISGIYDLRRAAPRWVIVLLLGAVIAPCEEIFWRGYIQSTLAYRFGDTRGLLLMATGYALVHFWAWNFMLIASAFVCGLFWGYLFHRLRSLLPCIISHVIWDLAVFVYYPIAH